MADLEKGLADLEREAVDCIKLQKRLPTREGNVRVVCYVHAASIVRGQIYNVTKRRLEEQARKEFDGK